MPWQSMVRSYSGHMPWIRTIFLRGAEFSAGCDRGGMLGQEDCGRCDERSRRMKMLFVCGAGSAVGMSVWHNSLFVAQLAC